MVRDSRRANPGPVPPAATDAMCLVVFRWAPHAARSVVLVGNRDEMHARPTAPLHRWSESGIVAGRDLSAGGTWFAAAPGGRFAVITNVRGAQQPARAPTRGALIPDFMAGAADPRAYLTARAKDASRYAGFTLILADASGPWIYSNVDGQPPRPLEPGVHGVSNGPFDAPWPKVLAARARLEGLADVGDTGRLTTLLADRTPAPDTTLPQTGLPLEQERRLSAAFIVHPTYGTRTTTTYVLEQNGSAVVTETGFRADGARERTVRINV